MKVTELYTQIKPEKEIQGKKTVRQDSVRPEAFQPASEKDRVELSHGSREVQRMQEILRQTPDVRAEKVQELKERIGRGEYQVDPQKIADRMLEGLLSEDLTPI